MKLECDNWNTHLVNPPTNEPDRVWEKQRKGSQRYIGSDFEIRLEVT